VLFDNRLTKPIPMRDALVITLLNVSEQAILETQRPNVSGTGFVNLLSKFLHRLGSGLVHDVFKKARKNYPGFCSV